MTHNFKIGVKYKTRGGMRVIYIGHGVECERPIFEYEAHGVNDPFPAVAHFFESEIVGLWEESPEEINVANMWVTIKRDNVGRVIECHTGIYTPTKPRKFDNDTIAIIRVHEWEAIKRGERKLIKGEGL